MVVSSRQRVLSSYSAHHFGLDSERVGTAQIIEILLGELELAALVGVIYLLHGLSFLIHFLHALHFQLAKLCQQVYAMSSMYDKACDIYEEIIAKG